LASERLLLVDDDETLRSGLGLVLEASGYQVTIAPGVSEALHLIASRVFDVLLTDLHMPGPGDGFTVISAFRHSRTGGLALLMSADRDLRGTSAAVRGQADEFFLKPLRATSVAQRIRELLDQRAGRSVHTPPPPPAEDVASVLESETDRIARQWLIEMDRPGGREPRQFSLSQAERTEHLPEALRDIIFRLRYPQPVGASTLFSMSALQHGARRRRQGAGAASLAEEARAFQLALFRTVESNRSRIDPSHLPAALMAIADEVNAQLLQAIEGYEKEDPPEPPFGFR
jgi:DNA-binding response OmpR family regulator